MPDRTLRRLPWRRRLRFFVLSRVLSLLHGEADRTPIMWCSDCGVGVRIPDDVLAGYADAAQWWSTHRCEHA